MEALSLQRVLTATRGHLIGTAPDLEFEGVSTDSRTIAPKDLFFALKGPNFDGHEFVEAAKSKKARGVVVSEFGPGRTSSDAFAVVRVPDTGRALLDLGRDVRKRHPARVIAITGSNGKTTTKDLMGCALTVGGPTLKSRLSFNNRIGLPLTLFGLEKETVHAVLEIGTSAPGEIAELAEVAKPSIAVITNVAESHLEGLGDLDGVRQEKGSLLDVLPKDGLAVLNADDPSFDALAERAPCRVVSFGILKHAQYMALDIKWGLKSLTFRLKGGERFLVPLTGCHNVSNVLATVAVAMELGLSPRMVSRALRQFEGPPGRLRPITCGDMTIIDDTYNANPGSVAAAFKTFSVLTVPARRVVILGDMKELGEHSESLHRDVGRLFYEDSVDQLVTVGKEARFIAEEALSKGMESSSLLHFDSPEEAAKSLEGWVRPNDAVLVKGSRAVGMERLVSALEAYGTREQAREKEPIQARTEGEELAMGL